MSLRDWVQYGWLTEHQSSREEIRNLLGLADRDLRACQAKGLDADWRFAIAYNAALQAATAALAASGYRAGRDSHHYRVFQSLEHTIEAEQELIHRLVPFGRSGTFRVTRWGVRFPTKRLRRWPRWRRSCALK
jgi:hypothetical protein